MAKGASVGLASSVTQSKAAQAKKQRKAAAVPTTPEIKATVAKIRANNSGTKAELTETPPNHDDVRESWRETVAEMKLVIRDMRARVNQEAQTVAPVKPPVVFETFVQVTDGEIAPIVVAPEPEPAPLAIMHPLPMAVMVENVKRGKAVNTNTPAVIALYAHEADMRRAEVRLRHEAETGESAPAPAKMDMGPRKFWMRNLDGTMEKREVAS